MPKLRHSFASAKADGSDATQVQPSHWNAALRYTDSAGAPSATEAVVREGLTAARTYYVRTDGSDANTGLADTAGGAFLTIQKAIDVVAELDAGIYNVTVQVRAGTYTGAVDLKTPPGSGSLTLLGDSATPANVVISTTSASCVTANRLSRRWIVEGFLLQTTTSGDCLYALGGGSAISFLNIRFGACAGYHLHAQYGAIMVATGNYAVAGGAVYHVYAELGGVVDTTARTVTITGTPAFTRWASATQTSAIIAKSMTFSGTATGVRYNADLNGIIDVGGGGATYLPGDSAGSTATGGQYA